MRVFLLIRFVQQDKLCPERQREIENVVMFGHGQLLEVSNMCEPYEMYLLWTG